MTASVGNGTSDTAADDQRYMALALALGRRGLGNTWPNPAVGAVIVKDGVIVGRGWTQPGGRPHAEVEALRRAKKAASGATMYVSLEPCSHHGKTPPCADAISKAGIARVVSALEDPNPEVAGAGHRRLIEAGVAVEVGVGADKARQLHAGHISRMRDGRPHVMLKLAASADGKVGAAGRKPIAITGEAARDRVALMRAESDAILVGIGTVLADDPRLTVRLDEPHIPPLRVVLDANLRTPADARVLDGAAPTLVAHAKSASPRGARFDRVDEAPFDADDGRLDLAAILAALAAREVNELQVESGPILSGALLAAGLVDEILLYVAPILLGDTARPIANLPPLASLADAPKLTLVEQTACGPDLRLRFLTETPHVHGHH